VTPAADDPLAAVLDEIARVEGRDEFEGPKIAADLIEFSPLKTATEEGWQAWEDNIVGKIGRACDTREWYLEIKGPYVRIESNTYYYTLITWEHQGGHGKGTSRALAAARAYLKAIKEIQE
jgi:hypothetical protein